MAGECLMVNDYYRVGDRYAAINRPQLLSQQADLVKRNLCSAEATLTLMQEYGFSYAYTFVSADGRFAGRVEADASTCA